MKPLKSNDLFLLALSDVTNQRNQPHPPDTYNDSSDSDSNVNFKPRRVLTPGAKLSSDEDEEDEDSDEEDVGRRVSRRILEKQKRHAKVRAKKSCQKAKEEEKGILILEFPFLKTSNI